MPHMTDESHRIERDHRDESGNDPRGHQERDRWNRHHFECVDLLADAHSSQLGGESGADRSGKRDSGEHRSAFTCVGVGGDEAGERFDTDVSEAE